MSRSNLIREDSEEFCRNCRLRLSKGVALGLVCKSWPSQDGVNACRVSLGGFSGAVGLTMLGMSRLSGTGQSPTTCCQAPLECNVSFSRLSRVLSDSRESCAVRQSRSVQPLPLLDS